MSEIIAKEKATLHSIVIIRRMGVKAERSWKNKMMYTATDRITITSGSRFAMKAWLS